MTCRASLCGAGFLQAAELTACADLQTATVFAVPLEQREVFASAAVLVLSARYSNPAPQSFARARSASSRQIPRSAPQRAPRQHRGGRSIGPLSAGRLKRDSTKRNGAEINLLPRRLPLGSMASLRVTLPRHPSSFPQRGTEDGFAVSQSSGNDAHDEDHVAGRRSHSR